MATGKKAQDIFTKTSKPKGKLPSISVDVPPRLKGRPSSPEAYHKVTVCLFDRQVLFLDEVALGIRKKTGRLVKRAELVRAILDQVADSVRPDKLDADFEKAIRSLLPSIEK